jgi:hypothetical protein
VKRVVAIYTRRPTTRLILFTFDCVLEQLWQTWSTNSKLQHILLEEIKLDQTSPSDLVNITSKLSSFRTNYSPIATRYSRKTTRLPQGQKASLQTDLLASTRALKSLLRNLRAWLAVSRISGQKIAPAALQTLFSSLFHQPFSELVHTLHRIAQVLDACAAPNPNPSTTLDLNINTSDSERDSTAPTTASQAPATAAQSSSRTGSTNARAVPSSSLSPTVLERALLYRRYLSLPSSSSVPRFWWCGYACDACAFEMTNDDGHWHCNRCNYGDFDLCSRCFIEAGGCKGQICGGKGLGVADGEGGEHMMEWVAHPFLENTWKKAKYSREQPF